MINRVTLIGNLGQAPEVKRLEGGSIVAKFSLATNESYRDKSGEWQQRTEWHSVVAWRQLAEKVEDWEKGQLVYLEGKLTHRSYEDRDGVNRKITEIVSNYARRINDRREVTTEVNGQSYNHPPKKSQSSATDDSGPSAEDDLPF